MNKIDQAKEYLLKNDIIGIPTETVYGLAASILSPKAIDKVFTIKERPSFDPLIVHVSSVQQAKEYTEYWDDRCEKLAQAFWPGPLTMILPKSDQISGKITAGLETVGIRMPKHDLTLELIKLLGHPIAAPSANKFSKTSPTTAEHVKKSFPNLFVLDGGPCLVGIESTIVGIHKNQIIIYRPGMISKDEIEEVLDTPVCYQESPVAPGHLQHHYMPNTPIITFDSNKKNELKSMCDPSHLKNPITWKLPSEAAIAARVLYGKFRSFDNERPSAILIEYDLEQLQDELFSGIFNRLQKASTFFI